MEKNNSLFCELIKKLRPFKEIERLKAENIALKGRCRFLEEERERLLQEQIKILRNLR